MEIEGQTNPETTEEVVNDFNQETQEVVEPETTETNESPESEGEQQELPFDPDFKFKYYGNEGELSENLRPLVKDQETLEAIKEIARKASSFDYIKETSKIEDLKGDSFKELLKSKSKIEEHYAPLEEKFNTVSENLKKLDIHASAGDYGTVFDNLGFKRDDIIKWAAHELALREASPEQRQQLEAQRQQISQQANLQYQNELNQQQVEMYKQQAEQYAVQTRAIEVQNELARPEVNEFVQKFDSVRGPGAFFQEVRQEGINEWNQKQVDLPPAEAVKRAMDKYAGFFQLNTQQAPQTQQAPSNPETKVVTPTQKASIPDMKGGAGSPIKHRPRSLEDLRKLSQQMG